MRWILILTILAMIMALALVACSGAKGGDPPNASPATLDGKALAEERCSQCHSYSRVEMARKSLDGWTVTVERMVGYGARLNKAQEQAVIDYLAKAYPQ